MSCENYCRWFNHSFMHIYANVNNELHNAQQLIDYLLKILRKMERKLQVTYFSDVQSVAKHNFTKSIIERLNTIKESLFMNIKISLNQIDSITHLIADKKISLQNGLHGAYSLYCQNCIKCDNLDHKIQTLQTQILFNTQLITQNSKIYLNYPKNLQIKRILAQLNEKKKHMFHQIQERKKWERDYQKKISEYFKYQMDSTNSKQHHLPYHQASNKYFLDENQDHTKRQSQQNPSTISFYLSESSQAMSLKRKFDQYFDIEIKMMMKKQQE